jgi:hypothetical protein
MRRTAVQKAWPKDSTPVRTLRVPPPTEERPRLLLDAESVARQISKKLRERDDHLFLAFGVIIVICSILILVLMALNARTLSRIEQLLRR